MEIKFGKKEKEKKRRDKKKKKKFLSCVVAYLKWSLSEEGLTTESVPNTWSKPCLRLLTLGGREG